MRHEREFLLQDSAFSFFSEKSALKYAAYFGFENAGGLPRAAGNKFVVHALLQICCADIGEIKA